MRRGGRFVGRVLAPLLPLLLLGVGGGGAAVISGLGRYDRLLSLLLRGEGAQKTCLLYRDIAGGGEG